MWQRSLRLVAALVATSALVAGRTAAQVVSTPGDLFVVEFFGRLAHIDPALPDGSNLIEVLPTGSLPSAQGMARSEGGELFVSASTPPPANLPAVYRVDSGSGASSVLTSGGSLVVPGALAVRRDGTLFVANFVPENPLIRVSPAGVQTVLRSTVPPNQPNGIAIAADGSLRVTDAIDTTGERGRILIVEPDPPGNFTGLTSALANPVGIVPAPNGDLFVVEQLEAPPGRVVRVAPAGAVSVVSSAGWLEQPGAITIADDGMLFVTNLGGSVGNSVIRVDPSIPDDGLGGNQTLIASGLGIVTGIAAVRTASVSLSLAQLLTPNPVSRGTPLEIELTVSNEGSADATGVEVGFDQPSFLFGSAVGCTVTQTAPLRCRIGELAAGTQATAFITVTPFAAGDFLNTATVTSNEPEADLADNESSDPITVVLPVGRSDLSLASSVDDDRPPAGGQVVYTVRVENLGPDPATNVEVTVPLPDEILFPPLVLGSPISRVILDPAARSLTWEIDDLALSAVESMAFQATLDPAVECRLVAMTARVRSDQEDLGLRGGPNTATQEVVVPSVGCADVAVAIDVSEPLPQRGDPLSYTVSVTNVGGPDVATGIAIEVEFPTDIDVVDPGAGVLDLLGRTVSWVVPSQDPGAPAATLTILAEVGPVATGEIPVEARRAPEPPPFDQADPDERNNQAEAAIRTGGGGGGQWVTRWTKCWGGAPPPPPPPAPTPG
ncbi:MAG: hypothetical protein QNK03_27430, partial [Myxococcota bacterium]|nr:hypothetical protein [Myxococcota bacterium]